MRPGLNFEIGHDLNFISTVYELIQCSVELEDMWFKYRYLEPNTVQL